MDARDQLVLVKRLGHVVVGAEAEAAYLVLDAGHAGEDQDRRLHLADAERAQHLIARDVGKVQIEQDNVVVVDLAEIDTLFAQIRGENVETFREQHQLDALCRCAIVFDKQYPHPIPLSFEAPPADRPCVAVRRGEWARLIPRQK